MISTTLVENWLDENQDSPDYDAVMKLFTACLIRDEIDTEIIQELVLLAGDRIGEH